MKEGLALICRPYLNEKYKIRFIRKIRALKN